MGTDRTKWIAAYRGKPPVGRINFVRSVTILQVVNGVQMPTFKNPAFPPPVVCGHFSLCSVQFVARYSLRSLRALRARLARFAGPPGEVQIVPCTILEGGEPPP